MPCHLAAENCEANEVSQNSTEIFQDLDLLD
jgi:hypothetical protein